MVGYFFPLSVKVNILRYGGQRLFHFFRGGPSYTKLLHLIVDYAGDSGAFISTGRWLRNWWQKSLVGTLFGVLSPDHVGSLCLARPTKPRLLGHHSAVEAERHPSVTYDSSLARKPKCRDKNHHTVLWSATGLELQNSPVSKRASSSSIAWAAWGLFPFAVLVNKWLSLRCKDFSGFFELIVLE